MYKPQNKCWIKKKGVLLSEGAGDLKNALALDLEMQNLEFVLPLVVLVLVQFSSLCPFQLFWSTNVYFVYRMLEVCGLLFAFTFTGSYG